ncbi:Putative DHN1 [Penicillium digitatum]|uniref:Cell surface protein n=3 Tax=Penicillium digitatum TaxID=36651 RepID=K9G6J3_PEND2|nr:hypothetical protein PDIP_55420 [Penicillium digitatum Pd1]EKV11652.1 hypothetical protein PDIP_55420 [Penicillium digitatum Pd1]EKV17039.1 hypothetical protein PDIG_17530 [Penicillium digitatum PHI26]KAG0152937.1 hypothetical protein PDIDSM_1896 [Penicillium digitatum]QQK43712.1 Putative DHN1 [Penicillium digitatum]
MQFVRKAEEALTGKKTESHESTKSSNHGPHSSNLANKLDPRVDSDKDHRAADIDGTSASVGVTHDTATATGTHGTTHGTTHGNTGVTGTHGTTGSTNTGPHSSNLANKADPRVDSDRDPRAAHTDVTGAGLGSPYAPITTTGTHSSALGSGTTHGTSGATATGAGLGSTHGTTGSTNAGPHSSNIANKLDPRVDSDRDNRARHEGLTGAGTGASLGTSHATIAPGTHGSTLGSGTTHGTTHGTTSNTHVGPHSSHIANKADPRVDSDHDHRTRHEGLPGASTGTGIGSTHATHGTTAPGTHSSTLSSRTGPTHGAPTATPGSSSTNAGPHSSNIANKLDPRVDSDRDSRVQHSGLASTGPGTTTHGTHSHGATVAPTGSAIGGSGLAAGHHDTLAGSSYNTPATGTAPGTTGPHDSSIANKLDPRVDSDAARAHNEGLHRQI